MQSRNYKSCKYSFFQWTGTYLLSSMPLTCKAFTKIFYFCRSLAVFFCMPHVCWLAFASAVLLHDMLVLPLFLLPSVVQGSNLTVNCTLQLINSFEKFVYYSIMSVICIFEKSTISVLSYFFFKIMVYVFVYLR